MKQISVVNVFTSGFFQILVAILFSTRLLAVPLSLKICRVFNPRARAKIEGIVIWSPILLVPILRCVRVATTQTSREKRTASSLMFDGIQSGLKFAYIRKVLHSAPDQILNAMFFQYSLDENISAESFPFFFPEILSERLH